MATATRSRKPRRAVKRKADAPELPPCDSYKFPLEVFVVHVVENGRIEQTDKILRRDEVGGYLGGFNQFAETTGRYATVVRAEVPGFYVGGRTGRHAVG